LIKNWRRFKISEVEVTSWMPFIISSAAEYHGRPKDECNVRDNLADVLAALKRTQNAAKNGDIDDITNELASACKSPKSS